MIRIDTLASLYQANHTSDKGKYALMLVKSRNNVEISIYHNNKEINKSTKTWPEMLKSLAAHGYDVSQEDVLDDTFELFAEPTSSHSVEGLTNELEDITDDQVSNIYSDLVTKSPANKTTDRDFRLDARRIFLGRDTVDSVVDMYNRRSVRSAE